MAEQFDNGNKLLGCSSDDLRSLAAQNDQVFIDNIKDDLTHESSSNENVFDQGQSPAKRSVSLTDYQDEKHQKGVENQHRSMVGLRQDAVDNPDLLNDISTSSGNVVDGLNGPVEHQQSVCGMVDRRQSTVEDTDGHSKAKHTFGISNTMHITGTQFNQFTKGSTQLGTAGEVVNCQKRTVQDDLPSVHNGHGVTNTTHLNGIQLTPQGITGNMVDRQKKTVQDDIPSVHNGHGVMNATQITGIQFTPQGITDNMVDLQEKTVEDDTPPIQNGHGVTNTTQTTGIGFTPPGITGNVVDRQKKTVEDDTPLVQVTTVNSHGVANVTQITSMQPTTFGIIGNTVDRQKRTVEDDTPSVQVTGANGHGVANATQITGMQPTTSGITGNMVDRHKKTVEDDTPSVQITGANGHGVAIATQITGVQPTTSGITGNMVNRQKKTVEDDTPSVQITGANGNGAANATQITGIQPTTSGITGNMVDCQKKTVEDDTPSVQVTGANGHGVANATQITGRQPTSSGTTGNIVDRQKRTVEDDTPSVQVIGANGHGVANATQITGVQPTTSGITGNMVDRQKKTVEDDTPSVQVTGANGHGVANATQITGMQPATSGMTGGIVDRQKRTIEDDAPSTLVTTGANGHSMANATKITGGMQTSLSREAACIVDREKKTVEDDAPSVQVRLRGVNGGHPSHLLGGTELEQQFKEGCSIGERQRTNSHPEAAKWKIQLDVSTACNRDIIEHLPPPKSCEWNQPVVFGRRIGVDIFINDDHASRDHMELIGQIFAGQVSFMTRNRSSKGYNKNGENIIETDRWIPLEEADKIKIAGLTCSVHITPGRDMDGFVIEFKLPKIQPSPVVIMPTPVYPVPVLLSPNGQAGFYNQYPTPHAGFPPVHPSPLYLPPNNSMPSPMQQYWPHGMQPGQPVGQHHQHYLPGHLQLIPNDMEETQFQPYQGREGYIRLEKLPYLAQDAVGEWTELGRALKLADWQLIAIERDIKSSVEKSYQMLKTWVHCNPEQATLENLKKALEDVTVGRDDLALKYCTVDTNGEENDHDSMSTDNNANDST